MVRRLTVLRITDRCWQASFSCLSVALGWAWLLSHEQGRQLDSAIGFSLYVFVWLIYALDRFFQAFGIDAEEDTVRHRFWFNYKYYLSIPVAIATAICVYLVFWVLPWEFLVCSFVLVMALSVCFRLAYSLPPAITPALF